MPWCDTLPEDIELNESASKVVSEAARLREARDARDARAAARSH